MIDATLNLLVILFIDFLKNVFLNTVASFLVEKKGRWDVLYFQGSRLKYLR